MLNFTVGPVQSSEEIRAIGSEQVPYFRTPEFSAIMLENEERMLSFTHAPEGSKAVFMTCSGSGSMEASVINTLNGNDNVLVVNGGSFGKRFVEILSIHGIRHTEIRLQYGKALTKEDLYRYDGKGYTAFVVNLHETSTGVLYDLGMIAGFCKKNGLFLIVDSISSFLADPFDMSEAGVDIMITGSQKALACPPGISIIVASPRALERINANDPHCLYLDLRAALKDQERGQTPFTPAVGLLRQINRRLKEIEAEGGVSAETAKIKDLANYFRNGIQNYPFEFFSESPSNAVTSLHPLNGVSAYTVFTILKDEYGIWVCPNGGDLKETVFRVGHIGCLERKDYDELFRAFDDLKKRGVI